jgi:hypothetical protein
VVIVVTDAEVNESERVIRAAPTGGVANAGIVRVSARESPRPQVMVTLRNDTALRSARVEVTAAGRTTAADAELPTPGAGTRDAFIDLPGLADVVFVRLVIEDSFEADNVAWLVRGGSWPRIEPRAALAPALARIVEVYAKSRPPGPGSASVSIVDDLRAVPPAAPAVVVAPAPAGGDPVEPPEGSRVEVLPHPVTRGLETGFRIPSFHLAQVAPAAWQPVVRLDGKAAVAVREAPARQVWVGLDSAQWATRPEYVVFWANVFDWLGGSGGPEFRGEAVAPLGAGWKRVDGDDATGGAGGGEPGLWPGLYERADDGARRGVNALDVHLPSGGAATRRAAGGDDWRGALGRALARADRGASLGPALFVLAVWCVAASALLWRRALRAGPALPTRAPKPAGTGRVV